ncbi:MAG: histidine phosphotransferase family protein [Rhodobacter sp.]|nr:histidine phosphotransferase family protein [Rhodobacter sp.]
MTRPPLNIAALMGSRICHDLISPIGAIANGVELLSMTGQSGPEIELISESAQNANARIRYFRVAFGAASEGQTISAGEIRTLLSDLTRGSKLQVDWQAAGDVPRIDARLVFLLMMCFETAMPWGGTVILSQTGREWSMSGRAERLKIDAPLWQTLSGSDAPSGISAAEVHFLMLPPLSVEAGRNLNVAYTDTEITARLT